MTNEEALFILKNTAWLGTEADRKKVEEALNVLERPELIWGLHASVGRPLGDLEIVPRLREIQKQIGGSYAIDRAVEVIEAIAERRTDDCQ